MENAIIKYRTRKNSRWNILRREDRRPMVYMNKRYARKAALNFKKKHGTFYFRVEEIQ